MADKQTEPLSLLAIELVDNVLSKHLSVLAVELVLEPVEKRVERVLAILPELLDLALEALNGRFEIVDLVLETLYSELVAIGALALVG